MTHKYTVSIRELNSLNPNAEYNRLAVCVDTIDEAIADALEFAALDRAHVEVYPGHDGYYSPDERIHESTIERDAWLASHADAVQAADRRRDEARREEELQREDALDSFYGRMSSV